ncbi:hypothetical protein CB0940_11984 [Cercospora beticola]|uniref:Uncharacterized protein n=1 Tax=Cercospora beticola TaxID=122368 RepID=A0A2G5IFH8_CERBT|nr:hypothetical protein CB0940_11984 [Cercospora beticola]PIB03223.1 hypothetical protein CB0940_11984 [Cercospora beticola]WPB04365.1 hypothetical protein RHO25_009011 [Cercospora beticola]CAK1356810.1 unnamed protein product [Cercospora beticola]
MSGPQIPRINTQDIQGQDVVSNSSDDHFSSASEGADNTPGQDYPPQSPIPITRVERVDDTPAHGEVPGTPAYSLRTQDAVPDEIEIVPEGRRSRSATLQIAGGRSRGNSAASNSSTGSRPMTPGGTPVPKLIVERVDNKPAHGEVEGTEAHAKRLADATPDEVRAASPIAASGENGHDQVEQDPENRQAWFRSMWEGNQDQQETPTQASTKMDANLQEDAAEDVPDDEDDFGDDFDDFAEGGEDDDFGDFDEPATPAPVPETQTYSLPDSLAGLPKLDLQPDISASDLQDAISPYLDLIFPDQPVPPPASAIPPLDMSNSSPFLSDRSLSLWQQLVQPPPMQPPNWTRSKIRRLFLVSLGVPVDLDEILPPSKQKRLVLPNINLASSDSKLDRLRSSDGANDSTTSLDSKTGAPKKSSQHKRTGTVKGPPPPPEFDSNRAALVCRTTEEAMKNMEDDELRQHVKTLEELNHEASSVLEYWLLRKDEGLKEKEALEGVIENLVGFVKGRRGGGK